MRKNIDMNKVARVIGSLRHGKPLRQLISRKSEVNLQRLAVVRPGQTKAFIKTLARLDQIAMPIDKLVVPAVLAEVQNKKALKPLRQMGVVGRLVCENGGVLDLRKLGLRNELGYIDLTPKYKPLQLADYRAIMKDSRHRLEIDHSLGDLFLFKAVLRLRIDLYVAGAERSKALARGEQPGMPPDFVALKEFIDQLTQTFPFGTTTERLQNKSDLHIASLLLDRQNNPAADAKLTSLFDDIEKIVSREIVERTRVSPKVTKVAHQAKGCWTITTSGFRQTGLGLKQKGPVTRQVRTPELLSMIQHQVDSIAAERESNLQTMAQLAFLKFRFPDYWDKLFEIHLKFTHYDALKKDKATCEMEGALELARVWTGPADRLARSLLTLAEIDLAQRDNELAAQQQRLTAVKQETEQAIGSRLGNFVGEMTDRLTATNLLYDPSITRITIDRLGRYLGSFLRGKMREEWLRSAKSRMTGTLRLTSLLLDQLQVKLQLLQSLNGARAAYSARRTEIWRRQTDTATRAEEIVRLDGETLATVRTTLAQVTAVNADIQRQLTTAVRLIMRVDHDFLNRAGEVITLDEYFAQRGGVLSQVNGLFSDRVRAVGFGKRALGIVLRRDAQLMGLDYEELT